jgi:hypothetical protein
LEQSLSTPPVLTAVTWKKYVVPALRPVTREFTGWPGAGAGVEDGTVRKEEAPQAGLDVRE